MAGHSIEVVLAEVFGDTHGSRLTFRDAVPQYLAYAESRKKPSTLAGDRWRLGMMMRAPWAGEFLTSLRTETLTKWATERTATLRAPSGEPSAPSVDGSAPRRRPRAISGATVNRDLNLGSALFRWAQSIGYVSENPFRQVPKFSEKGRAREVFLTAAESRALMDSGSPFVRPVLVAALSTGMRRGELLALRWRAVDLDRRSVRVEAETEKTGRGRSVPMTALLHGTLTALKDERSVLALSGADAVFRCADGSPLTIKVLRLAFSSAVRACEAIPLDKRARLRFHDLRHTAASLMVAAGVPIFDIAKTLGHSSVAVTMRYAHFAPEAGRSAVDRLGEALGTPGREAADAARRTG